MTGRQCEHIVTGPRMGYRLVLWSRRCLRTAAKGSRYCWQHAAEHSLDTRRWSS